MSFFQRPSPQEIPLPQRSATIPYEVVQNTLQFQLNYMKSVRLLRWSGPVLSFSTRSNYAYLTCHHYPDIPSFRRDNRLQSTSAQTQRLSLIEDDPDSPLTRLPSPSLSRARASARLNALHARLSLSPRLPLETLARCLVHPSADLNPHFNNASLAVLGQDILGYYLMSLSQITHRSRLLCYDGLLWSQNFGRHSARMGCRDCSSPWWRSRSCFITILSTRSWERCYQQHRHTS